MAHPREAIERVRAFEGTLIQSGNGEVSTALKGNARINLGDVAPGVRVVYGIFPYQQRLVSEPSEPVLASWTRQPVTAVERYVPAGEGTSVVERQALAYSADLRGLGEPLAAQVLDHLQAVQARLVK